LEKNGKASSSKCTKHVDVRCFFVTDRINKNELSVEWCPTGNVIGDHATEPLQGPTFKKFRDCIVGVVSVPAEEPAKKSPCQLETRLEDPSSRQMFGDRRDRHHRSVLGLRDSWNKSLSARRTCRAEGTWRRCFVATSATLGTRSPRSVREPS
jgi:hypothetical protein